MMSFSVFATIPQFFCFDTPGEAALKSDIVCDVLSALQTPCTGRQNVSRLRSPKVGQLIENKSVCQSCVCLS